MTSWARRKSLRFILCHRPTKHSPSSSLPTERMSPFIEEHRSIIATDAKHLQRHAERITNTLPYHADYTHFKCEVSEARLVTRSTSALVEKLFNFSSVCDNLPPPRLASTAWLFPKLAFLQSTKTRKRRTSSDAEENSLNACTNSLALLPIVPQH